VREYGKKAKGRRRGEGRERWKEGEREAP